MKGKTNTYVAILLLVISGSGAAMLILHVALDNHFAQTQQDNDLRNLLLEQSILNSN